MPETVKDTDWLLEVEAQDTPGAQALREVRRFAEDYKKFAGLLTSKQVQGLLGVSKQRISQMVEAGILERKKYDGSTYYTGRSVIARISEPVHKGGRGKKGLTLGDRLRFYAGAIDRA